LIGIDWFISIAKSRVVLVSSRETTRRRFATFVDSLSSDVSRGVVTGKKARLVAISVPRKSTSDIRRAIISHLREVTDIVAIYKRIDQLIIYYWDNFNLQVPPTALVYGRLVCKLVLVEPDQHRVDHQAGDIFKAPRLPTPCQILTGESKLPWRMRKVEKIVTCGRRFWFLLPARDSKDFNFYDHR
jgi:hypothetical protein